MSKTNNLVLLLPGESGWEIWMRTTEGEFVLQRAADAATAGELKDIPAGELSLLFPMRAFTALPMRVLSNDEALFPDLVAMHMERLGIRIDPMAGQLSDYFLVEQTSESTILTAVCARPPGEGELPRKSPKSFDISARAFAPHGNVLAVWKELGRWVFAVFKNGIFLHGQATTVEAQHPDASLAQEIRLAMTQLSIQGIGFELERVIVWSSLEQVDLRPLNGVFLAPVEHSPRPAPVLPQTLSKLLPEDVRAARREARRRLSIQLASAAVAVFYLGLIGWLVFGLWMTRRETQDLIQQAQQAAPQMAAYDAHIRNWAELSEAIDLNLSPLDAFSRIATCIPAGTGLRLKIADISSQIIILRGEAPNYESISKFHLNLTGHNGLKRYQWQKPVTDSTDKGWTFEYRAEIPITPP